MILTLDGFIQYKKKWELLREDCKNNTKKRLLEGISTYWVPTFKYLNDRTQEFNDNCLAYENYNYRHYKNLPWNYVWDQDELYEGLTKTMPIDTFVEHFPNILNITMDIVKDQYTGTKTPCVTMAILYSDKEKYDKQIRQYARTCGYFIANDYKSLGTDGKTHICVYDLEPKFIVKCTDIVYNKEKYAHIIYHITLGKRYDKIKNNGLIPKSHNKQSEHPERIYFFLPGIYTKLDFILQAHNFYKPNGVYNNEISKYMLNKHGELDIVVLKIDLSKSKFQYEFFYDPNHPDGMFTYECINPRCVDIQYEFSI